MTIPFAGTIGRSGLGGQAWASLEYLLGLRALGHEVLYIEDTGECIYDPEQDTLSEDPSYGTRYIHSALRAFDLGDSWSFVNYDGSYHGLSKEGVRDFCADADLFINLSGGSWFWRDEYAKIPRRVFIDSDPVFMQLAIAKGEEWYVDFFRGFDHLFTFGANIGTAASPVPVGGFTWRHTWQPIALDQWRAACPPGDRFTTVMTWQIESFADVGGNKDQEFKKFIDLPSQTSQRFTLGVNGPEGLLRQHGWDTVPAMNISRTLWDYRAFIQQSKAEFAVAKHTYVATSSRIAWDGRTPSSRVEASVGFSGAGCVTRRHAADGPPDGEAGNSPATAGRLATAHGILLLVPADSSPAAVSTLVPPLACTTRISEPSRIKLVPMVTTCSRNEASLAFNDRSAPSANEPIRRGRLPI